MRNLLHLAFVFAVACGLTACSRQSEPAARETHPQAKVAVPPAPTAPLTTPSPSVHAGAAGADHGSWAAAGDSVPEALRDSCAKVNDMFRTVVGAAPPSTKITELVGPRPITFSYQFVKAKSGGCEFVARGSDSDSSSGLFEATEKAFDAAGWKSMEATYSADGPDGSDLGYARDGLLCVIEGRWDGGDDSDPSVVPGPDFDVFITCAPQRADDQPPS